MQLFCRLLYVEQTAILQLILALALAKTGKGYYIFYNVSNNQYRSKFVTLSGNVCGSLSALSTSVRCSQREHIYALPVAMELYKSLASLRLISQQEQADYALIDHHAYVVICSPFTAMLPHSSCAGCKCCLHLRKNLCFLTEGSERLHKEEASDEDEFFDAMEDSPAFITVTATENTQHRLVAVRGSLKLWKIRQLIKLKNVFCSCCDFSANTTINNIWASSSLLLPSGFFWSIKPVLVPWDNLFVPLVPFNSRE